MKAYLIVRAEVASEADRDAFDQWYQTEHLPDAIAAFKDYGADNARRGWSDVDARVHYGIYQFPDLAAAQAATTSDAITALIAEFDRVWQDRVLRSRDIVELSQEIDA